MSRKRTGTNAGSEKPQERVSAATVREEAARRRKRQAMVKQARNWTIILLLVAGVGAWMFIPRKGSYTAGGTGETIDGVQVYSNRTGHTPGAVSYAQTPPTGGEHNPTWLNCGIYTEAVPNVYAVHSLEHGAVWVTYDPQQLSADALAALREHLPSSYVVLSPYAGAGSPIVLSAWNVQLRVNSPDDPRIPRFLEEYWRNQHVPEPGALCTGGLDGPGRSS